MIYVDKIFMLDMLIDICLFVFFDMLHMYSTFTRMECLLGICSSHEMSSMGKIIDLVVML